MALSLCCGHLLRFARQQHITGPISLLGVRSFARATGSYLLQRSRRKHLTAQHGAATNRRYSPTASRFWLNAGRAPRQPVLEDDPLVTELEALSSPLPQAAGSDLSDVDEDLLAGMDAAAAADGGVDAARLARGDPVRTPSLRRPWLEPRFVQRSHLEGAIAAAAGGSDDAGFDAVGGEHTRAPVSSLNSSAARENDGSSEPEFVRRSSVPELYQNINLDRSSKARLLARDETVPGLGGIGWGGEDSADTAAPRQTYMDSASKLPQRGMTVDYCIYCYHGTSFLGAENGALLSKFVSERGSILPKRFTKCCAKHQRRLARTIRRARWLNLIPWHEKLHPKLRFSSLKPDPLIPSGSSSVASSSGNTSGGAEALDSSREERFSGPDRGAAITGSYAADVNAALAEINRIAAGTDSAAQR